MSPEVHPKSFGTFEKQAPGPSSKVAQYYPANMYDQNIIQLSPEGEVNSGGYIPRREASRYISTKK